MLIITIINAIVATSKVDLYKTNQEADVGVGNNDP